MASTQDAAAQTLSVLEERLRRIDFVVNGGTPTKVSAGAIETSGSAGARLRSLERNLQSLANKSFTVSEVLQLQKRHPELFNPTDPRSTPSTLPPAALVQLILAHEDLLKSSASQFSMLNEVKEVPDSTPMSKLLALEARTQALKETQDKQAQEFTQLRTRSAKVLERWYETGVIDMGGRWAEWEERLKDCEILVRRNEAAKKREEGTV